MSIQRTAESALYALEELYKAIDISVQQPSPMSINDSENLVHALCNLSQLINHINQTGMCGHTPMMDTNFDSNRFNQQKVKTFIDPHRTSYDENIMMDSATIGPPPQPGQPYGECVLYHPIRIITTCANGPTVLHESDFVRKKGQYRKGHDHNKRFLHHNQTKKNRRRTSKSHGRDSKSITQASRTSRSGSRRSRMSRQSRRSSGGRTSQSRGRSSRSSRRSGSRSFRSSRSSRSRYRRSNSRGRRSRSSQKGSRRSRSSQRRSQSRRRSSHKRRSVDQQNRQYHKHQIPSRPVSTTTSSAPFQPINQMASTSITTQSSTQQPYVGSLLSPVPITTTTNGPILPPPSFTPTISLPPPPAISALHHSHPSQLHGNNTSVFRPVTNPSNDQSPSYQQVPVSTTNTGNTSLSSINPISNIPTQNGPLSSDISPLQTTHSTLTSRSDNCPECRAITRLLQWAPLKCYDAAGIRRGVFLAGPKSEQLLKALYSSIKDSSLSLDDIEDCLCDNE